MVFIIVIIIQFYNRSIFYKYFTYNNFRVHNVNKQDIIQIDQYYYQYVYNILKFQKFSILNFLKFYTQKSMLPNFAVNYMAGFNLKNLMTSLEQASKIQANDQYKKYPRRKSYIIQSDWEVNTENGGLKLISKQKKKNQGKIIKFVLKKFITTGSFMGISFPVFAMKPQSILETYVKSIAAAPLLFDQIQKDPVQRIKKFIAFTFTFSRLFADMDKPFNSVIGQTFQAQIAGGNYSAQQTSHHPPQSSFYFQGKGYILYGTLQLVAEVGVNSAHGFFHGEIFVQFADGGKVFGRILAGQMSGFLVGQNKFRPSGSCYAYDPINKMICSYKRETKDLFLGQLGILRQKYQLKFNQILKSQDRFTSKYQSFKQKDYQCILSNMSAVWTKNVSFNKKPYILFQDPRYLPFQPQVPTQNLLPSDSRHRKDIKYRANNQLSQSQKQKQRIQNIQRYNRKLRAGQKNPKIQPDDIQKMQEDQLINDN